MGIQHHFLGFPGVGHQEHLPTVAEPEMGQLYGLDAPPQLHLFVTPVKLAGLARGKGQRDEGLCSSSWRGALPLFHEALNAVIGPGIARLLQVLKEPLGPDTAYSRAAVIDRVTAAYLRRQFTRKVNPHKKPSLPQRRPHYPTPPSPFCAHHFCHISRNAFSSARAIRGASISGLACMRSRRLARRRLSRSWSFASATARLK